MASGIFRQRFMNALNNERATPPPTVSEASAPLLGCCCSSCRGRHAHAGGIDDVRSAAAARLEKLVVCDGRAAEQFVQAGGISALISIITAAPAKSAHPLAICVGQMAAAVALQHILMRLDAAEAVVKGGVMPGLVRMLEEGQPPMQRAASNLLATLVNLQSGRQALCETDSGLVLTVLLKTSRRPLARQTAAQCLLRLVQHLAPEERFISHAHALPLNVARPKPVRPQLVDF